MKRIIWEERCSAWLYFYHYLFFIVVAIGLNYTGAIYALIPLLGLVLFVIDAKSMNYEVLEDQVFISSSLFDNESLTVQLQDIKGFVVIDRPPWNFFSLGTVILITDFNLSEHPCIKCIKNPRKLARLIKRHALKQGAQIDAGFI